MTIILNLLLYLCDADPMCENPANPLPTIGSCLHVVAKIWTESDEYPYLYEWSHHPNGDNDMKLPRTWTDESSYYSYRCAITVDTIRGHEKDADSFSFKDVSIVANRIINECLLPEHGIRPQIGTDLIGFFHRPKLVGVYLHSVRWDSLDKANKTSLISTGNGTLAAGTS